MFWSVDQLWSVPSCMWHFSIPDLVIILIRWKKCLVVYSESVCDQRYFCFFDKRKLSDNIKLSVLRTVMPCWPSPARVVCLSGCITYLLIFSAIAPCCCCLTGLVRRYLTSRWSTRLTLTCGRCGQRLRQRVSALMKTLSCCEISWLFSRTICCC